MDIDSIFSFLGVAGLLPAIGFAVKLFSDIHNQQQNLENRMHSKAKNIIKVLESEYASPKVKAELKDRVEKEYFHGVFRIRGVKAYRNALINLSNISDKLDMYGIKKAERYFVYDDGKTSIKSRPWYKLKQNVISGCLISILLLGLLSIIGWMYVFVISKGAILQYTDWYFVVYALISYGFIAYSLAQDLQAITWAMVIAKVAKDNPEVMQVDQSYEKYNEIMWDGWWLWGIILLLLVANISVYSTKLINAYLPLSPVDDFVKVSQADWSADIPYPFTTDGEIMCDSDAIYFYPNDTGDDESQVAQPLNQSAVDRMRDAKLQQTVPDTVKGSLSDDAIQILVKMCPKN